MRGKIHRLLMGVSVTKASASARERGERRRGGGDGAEAAEPIDRSFPTGRRGANRGSAGKERAKGGGKRKAMREQIRRFEILLMGYLLSQILGRMD